MSDLQSELVKEYTKWVVERGYPALSVDELLSETVLIAGTSEAQESYEDYLVRGEDRLWLKDFIESWNIAGL